MHSLRREIFPTSFEFNRLLSVRTCNVDFSIATVQPTFQSIRSRKSRIFFYHSAGFKFDESDVLNGPLFSDFSQS